MKKQLALLIFCLLACFGFLPAAQAAPISAGASYVHTENVSGPVAPYESVDVAIGVLDRDGQPLEEAPDPGKIYVWASEGNSLEPSPNMELLLRSVPADLPMHPTDIPGVLIIDAPALQNPRDFKVRFTNSGDYTIKAIRLAPDSPFNTGAMPIYEHSLFDASDVASRSVQVGSTPTRDVGHIFITPSVNSIETGAISVSPPRNKVVEDKTVPVHEDGRTRTLLTFRLSRYNGQPVGADVPVFVTTSAKGVQIANGEVRTGADGSASVTLNGDAGSNGFLGIRLNKGDAPILIPLRSYRYEPHAVRLDIGRTVMDVDGRNISLDSAAVVKNGRTFVPYRAIGEILGASIDYNPSIQTITTFYDKHTITMTIGYNRYALDSDIRTMDAHPYINENGRTMVPLRFIAEATGYSVRAIADEQGHTATVIFGR